MTPALSDYALALRTRWRWVAWAALLGLAAAVLALLVLPPTYRSATTVFVRTPGDVSRAIDGGDTYAQHRAATYAGFASSPDLAAEVVADLGLDVTPGDLAERVTATNQPGTVLIDVGVDAGTAAEAQRIAKVFLTVFAERVSALEAVDGSVVPRAELVVVNAPSTPGRRLAWGVPVPVVLLAATFVGAMLGALLATIRFAFDGAVRDPRDITRATGLRVLGPIDSPTDDPRLAARGLLTALNDQNRGVVLVAAAAADTDTAAVARMLANALRELTGSADFVDGMARGGVGLSERIRESREEFRWLIVTCAPVLSAVDVNLLADSADAVALLMPLGAIDEEQLRDASSTLPKELVKVVLLCSAGEGTDRNGRAVEEKVRRW